MFFLTENLDNNNESNLESIYFHEAQEASLQNNQVNIGCCDLGRENQNIKSTLHTTAKAVRKKNTNDKKLKSLRQPILNKDPKIKNFITDYFKIYQFKPSSMHFYPDLYNKNINLSHLQEFKDKIKFIPHESKLRSQQPINYKAKIAKIV